MTSDQEFFAWLRSKDPLLAEGLAAQQALMARIRGRRKDARAAPRPRPGRLFGPADAPLAIRLRHELGHAVVATVLAGPVVDEVDCREDNPHVSFSWRPGVSQKVVLAVLAAGSAAERNLGLRAEAYFGPFDVGSGDADDMKAAAEVLGRGSLFYTHDEWQRADALAREVLDANRRFLLDAEDAVRRAGGVMDGKTFAEVARRHGYR